MMSKPASSTSAYATRDAAVVILNWNCADDTIELADSLPLSVQQTLVVVDNGSVMADVDRLRSRAHRWRALVERTENGGYAAGMNSGMRAAVNLGFRSAVLLNADSRPRVDHLERMEEALDSGAVLVGISQRGPRGPYPTAAVGVSPHARPFECAGCAAGAHYVDVVSGAALLVDLDHVIDAGAFDERYFHYAEEVDLCLRLRKTGAKIIWICSSAVPHAVGGSLPQDSGPAHYYWTRNKILLVRAHQTLWFLRPRLAKDVALFAVRAGRSRALGYWWRGLLDGLRGRSGRLRS